MYVYRDYDNAPLRLIMQHLFVVFWGQLIRAVERYAVSRRWPEILCSRLLGVTCQQLLHSDYSPIGPKD